MNLKPKISAEVLAISEQLRGAQHTFDCVAYGHTYGMHTLEPKEEDAANGLVTSAGILQGGTMVRKAHVIVALTSIDGVPVERAFALPETPSPERAALLEDGEALREWRWRAMLDHFNETTPELFDLLFDALMKANRERADRLGRIGPLPASTPSGAS